MSVSSTNRRLAESVATIRVDDTPADNPRLAIHVEHPSHDGGVRCFYRRRDSDVARTIRRHLDHGLPDTVERVEVIDEAGLNLPEVELLPSRMADSRPGEHTLSLEVTA